MNARLCERLVWLVKILRMQSLPSVSSCFHVAQFMLPKMAKFIGSDLQFEIELGSQHGKT